MLSRESVQIGGQIAEAMMANGCALDVAPNSPIGILNNALHSVDVDKTGMEIGEELIKASTPLEHFRFDQHGGELEAIAKFIAPKLAGSISFARNEVSDLWKKTLAECTKAQAEAMQAKPIDVKIVPIVESEIFDDYAFEGLIKDFTTWAGKPRQKVSAELISKVNAAINAETFAKVTSTGIATLDEKVKTLIAKAEALGEWNMESSWYGLEDYTGLPFGTQIIRNRDIISFMFVRGLMAGKLRDVIGDLSEQDHLALSAYARFYGEHVNKRMGNIEIARGREEFALGGGSDKQLLVYKPKYLAWIKEGGSTEAVLGAILEHGSMPAANRAIGNVARYEQIYQRKSSLKKNVNTAKSNRIVDDTIRRCLNKFIEEEYADNVDKQAEYCARLKKKLYKMEYNSSRDLSDHVMVLVCLVIAHETNALDQLQGMEEYLRNNPEASVQEAAVHASTKIVADWLANGIMVKDVSSTNISNGRAPTLVKWD